MTDHLLTVEQAAARLKLHPKTVLRHIRDGKLRANRIGKSYRIAQSAVNALAGIGGHAIGMNSDARATCTIDVRNISAAAANRIAMYLGAATGGGDGTSPPLHVSTAYDPDLDALKVVVIGAPSDVAQVLQLYRALREDRA